MKKITHWVLGTATARVSGDTARFMNIAVKTGLRPIRLQKDGKDVLFTLYAKDYKKLHKIKQRTHARVKLAEKSGFPFRFRRMLRRPGLLLGTALGVALMLFLSGFYWEMTISGEDIPYAESEILAAAKRVGMYIGAPRSIDTALASVALLEELPELSWASFNTEGCTVQLELRTSVTKAEGAEHDGTGDIVASRAGLIRIAGEVRSFNNHSGEGSKLVISVFARELSPPETPVWVNEVELTGTLCKSPNRRTTPMGREICDLMLAVNRLYGRSDYLPCIVWGQNARRAALWDVGTRVHLLGRIQSREYIKNLDGQAVRRTAYEISVSDIAALPAE